ncbi:MAG: IS110 family transposase [SAR202 cluster bacterium]|nr:IS110 family transposase [SAR202 cluster bacterium]MDP6799121.1 IS110 family transposase [SAR202 cluster bacterium]|tara:strand:- start:24 stop:1400 length:1377 start_codon:yes stop_codon:yes gene_type:complete
MQNKQLNGPDQSQRPEFLQINLNAAGIDVGSRNHYVAVRQDRDKQPVRMFDAFTADLYDLADWLEACGVETVAMESTGVYWIPLFDVLEQRGFEVKLVDPRRLKSVPGRKTDVVDCQWLQQLHTYGLLSGAFRPPECIRQLRSYLRHRSMLIEYAAHHIQHMQKALTQMNMKLQHVLSDITGKTGMDIIRAIIAGERDPLKLAELRNYRVRADKETIAKALQGHWQDEHLLELTHAVELYDAYHEKVAECDQRIEAHLNTFEDRSDGEDVERDPRKRTQQHNAPKFDLQTYMYQMTGVDLTKIDGIDGYTVLKLISEIGLDMNQWPTAKHFASWLGLCPGSKITGGKQKSSRSKVSASRAAAALRLSAGSLHSSKTALGAYLRRKKAKMGSPEAITATAHKLARLVYAMLKYGRDYMDAGQDYYERQYRERVLRNMTRTAEQLGYKLVMIADPDLEPA